jgi:hypothetical protein
MSDDKIRTVRVAGRSDPNPDPERVSVKVVYREAREEPPTASPRSPRPPVFDPTDPVRPEGEIESRIRLREMERDWAQFKARFAALPEFL